MRAIVAMKAGKDALIELARRQIGTLQSELKFQAAHQKADPSQREEALRKLYKHIGESRRVLLHLSTYLEKTRDEPDDCPEVISLGEVLSEASLFKSQLEDDVFFNQKRGSLKAFEESIIKMIEDGKAPYYIKHVSKQELVNHGDEVNRLFQLLVESKRAKNSLFIDSVTLANASQRGDLFSPKQCAVLQRRSQEVEKLMREEIERLVLDISSKEDADNIRRQLQMLSSSLPVPITRASDVPPESRWTCASCTFRNEHSDAVNPKCRLCTASRSPSFVAVARRKPATVSEKNHIIQCSKTAALAAAKKVPTKNTVWIRNADVPELIGPKGRNIQKMKQDTGATQIYAYQDHVDESGMCPVEIDGTQSAIRATIWLIEQKFPLTRHAHRAFHSTRDDATLASHTIFIKNADVPSLIGQKGKSIQSLIVESGAQTIYAHQDRIDKNNMMCPIEIRGTKRSIQKAETMIQQRCSTKPVQHRTLWIVNADVPEFIGPGGAHAKSLKKDSGLDFVTADQDNAFQGMCPVRLEGSQAAILKASSFIEHVFAGIPDDTTVEVQASERKTGPIDSAGGIVFESPSILLRQALAQNASSKTIEWRRPSEENKRLPVSRPAVSAPPINASGGVVGKSAGLMAMSSLSTPARESRRSEQPSGNSLPSEEAHALFTFLQNHEDCLSCTADAFHSWLRSVHITSFTDLSEALDDDEFAAKELKNNGLKYFKRFALRSAIPKETTSKSEPGGSEERGLSSIGSAKFPQGLGSAAHQPPSELICPIEHVLFHDPVLACDGHCYERKAIELWFKKSQSPDIRPVLSPITGEPLEDLTLVPNVPIRTMSRDFARQHPDAR